MSFTRLTSSQSAVSPPEERAGKPDAQWAWSPYQPDASRPWNLALAAHLLRRTSFGCSWPQLQKAVEDGPQASVDRIVRPEADVAAFDRSLDEYDDAAGRSGNIESLRAWWLRRIVQTPFPLREKMTLFWHSRLGVSNDRVKNAAMMVGHIRLLRDHALGSYTDLLDGVMDDPALFLGYDAQQSRKALPNENLPRQLLARLTLGPEHYGQEDLRDAARAFTGWFVLRGDLRFFEREHDTGPKTVLGRKGNWNARDVVQIVLEDPASPRRLVRELYRWFVSEATEPDSTLLDPLTDMLAEDYNVGRVVETLLRSNLFFSSVAYRQRVKSPVEYAVGIVKGLGGSIPTLPLGNDLARLGQNLFHPPTTKGWVGGRHWLNGATVLARANLAHAMLAAKSAYGGKLDPGETLRKYNYSTPEAAAKFFVDLFLQSDVPAEVSESLTTLTNLEDQSVRDFVHQVVTIPEFHLD
jgi:uncharacterized protein (DUF1800 family)